MCYINEVSFVLGLFVGIMLEAVFALINVLFNHK